MTHRDWLAAFLGAGAIGAAAHGFGTIVKVERVTYEGDFLGDVVQVDSLNTPWTDDLNRVAFNGNASNGDRFIWYGDGVIFVDSDALPDDLSGGESTMGISNFGEFIYSPNFNGEDSVYSSNGVIVAGTDPAPGLKGNFVTFASRPQMATANGAAYWVSGIADDPDASTQFRVLYRSANAGEGEPEVVLAAGDVIDGSTLSDDGVDFNYDISRDGTQMINEVVFTGSDATNNAIVVNGVMVAREGTLNGAGSNWDNFDMTSINDAGDYLFCGDTDGDAGSDEFIAVNNVIALTEGMVVNGVELTSGHTVRAMSLNNQGKVVHIWGEGFGSTAVEYLFVGDASALPDSKLVLSRGDFVDYDDDGSADAMVDDFNASTVIGPGLDLADGRFAYVEVDLIDIGEKDEYEAILKVELFEAADLNMDCVVDTIDLLALLGAWGPCDAPCPPTCAADLNGDCVVDTIDLLALLGSWTGNPGP